MFCVIGSRKHSEYGELMTTKLTAELSKEFIIVSGLAKGMIDRSQDSNRKCAKQSEF